ncbi:hypothetical protein ACZ11_23845 [Lysinibacillus xylanilyticus]|uniref:Uncharacterized protein n=1 Tax=Lysinibacillus xylanilyticus TaxID=582475 RepID=A0A0K9F152_9BACI|nr:hypothetical protein ACZ11_23845 [Lysinibacillus xylanilyticus]
MVNLDSIKYENTAKIIIVAVFQQQLEKIRAEYLKKSKNKQINNMNENIGTLKSPYVLLFN